MTDSMYLAYGLPSEPGESKYIPAKQGNYRRATPNEIAYRLQHLTERQVIAADQAKLCYVHEDGESFMVDSMAELEAIIIDQMD